MYSTARRGSGLVGLKSEKGELPKREGWVAHSGAGSRRSCLVYIICVDVFPTFIITRNWQTNYVLVEGKKKKDHLICVYGLGREKKLLSATGTFAR